jgi:hypothetical protein
MKYYIIAGEASGDLHGSNLMKGIYAEDPQADIRFWGGDCMNDVWNSHQDIEGLMAGADRGRQDPPSHFVDARCKSPLGCLLIAHEVWRLSSFPPPGKFGNKRTLLPDLYNSTHHQKSGKCENSAKNRPDYVKFWLKIARIMRK